MMIHWKAGLWMCLVAGIFVGTLAAAVIGYLCIQRIGIYFIMLTFGFNQMLFFVAYKWTCLTGGDDGLPGIPRPPFSVGALSVSLDTSVRYYAFVAAAFLLAFYTMKRVVDSPLGVIFRAIRENPGRAAAVGYDVKRYKWLAFTIAGGFTGFAGVLYSMMFGIVPMESISWIISGDIVFMVLIGGIGNLYGPLVGAAAFKWLSETVSVVWERWPLILGRLWWWWCCFSAAGWSKYSCDSATRRARGARPESGEDGRVPVRAERERARERRAHPPDRAADLRLRRPPRRQSGEPERDAGHAALCSSAPMARARRRSST